MKEKVEQVEGSVYHEARKRETSRVKKNSKGPEIKETWYTLIPKLDSKGRQYHKIVLHQKTATGINTYYVGKATSKAGKEFLAKIKAAGQVRAS